MGMSVSSLNIYPIKSCGQISLQKMLLDDFGPQWDRRWMLVDLNGVFLTQREINKMAWVSVKVSEDGMLSIIAPGLEPLTLDSRQVHTMMDVQIWLDNSRGVDMGDDAAQWFSKFLEVECRLVFMSENINRFADRSYVDRRQKVSYADGFPLLLTTEASLEAVNQCLVRSSSLEPITMGRFRPNLVIKGEFEPFAEESWQQIQVGEIIFDLVKPCSRCVIPSINPVSLENQSPVIRALKETCDRQGIIYFGQNIVHQTPGQIALGDEVKILK